MGLQICLKFLAIWLPFVSTSTKVAPAGSAINLPCNVNSKTKEYSWMHNGSTINSHFRLSSGQFSNISPTSGDNWSLHLPSGSLTLEHVDISDSGVWKCVRQDGLRRIEVTHFLHILLSNKLRFILDEVEHGFLDCSSSDALPSDTLKVVLSANSDGTSPIMELSSWTKTIYWSANNITTRFQLPSINSWFATLFFVCIQQREVNGMSINVASTFKLASEVTSRAQRLGTLAESMQDEVLTQARNKNTSNLKRAYVFAHYEHKDWIHNQKHSIICKSILGNPKAELTAVISKDPLMIDVVQILKMESLTEIIHLGVASGKFDYTSNYKHEGYFFVCGATQKIHNEVAHEAIDSIRIVDVKFPPEIVSGSTTNVMLPKSWTETVRANPLPKIEDVHLIPCQQAKGSRGPKVNISQMEMPRTELVNSGKHSVEIKISFSHKKHYNGPDCFVLVIENGFGSVNKTINVNQAPPGSGVLGGILSVSILLSILVMLSFVLRAMKGRDKEEKLANEKGPFEELIATNNGFSEKN